MHGFIDKKHRTLFWVSLVVLTLATIGLSLWLMGPSPPRRFVLATGQAGGGYDTFGKKYQTRLARMGLEVELVRTNGSVDNFKRLVQGEVDVAFAQGGTYKLADDPGQVCRGLVAVYHEPLWIFYRGSKPVPTLNNFRGRAIAIGPRDSGTAAVAARLLKTHGITADNSRLVHRTTAEACKELKAGKLDVAVFISSYLDPGVQDLLRQQGILLMNFKRHDVAHSRQFPYLKTVKLAEGLLNLKDNIPREEEVLLAPAAILVCRKDLHPQVVEQVLKAARTIHSGGSLIDPPNQFPTLEAVDVTIHETADTYMKSGESFLSRVLPYWGVRLLMQMRILILPILAIWLPFLKILPMIYNYRVNGLLKRHYTALKEVEARIAHAETPEDLQARLLALERLRTDMEALSRKVPAHLHRDVYQWRLHVALVRTEALERLKRLQEKQDETAADVLPLAQRQSS